MSEPDRKPVTLEIYLKSGQTISLSVLDWSFKRGAIDKDLREFSWTMADQAKLPYLALEEVAAIVERVPA